MQQCHVIGTRRVEHAAAADAAVARELPVVRTLAATDVCGRRTVAGRALGLHCMHLLSVSDVSAVYIDVRVHLHQNSFRHV